MNDRKAVQSWYSISIINDEGEWVDITPQIEQFNVTTEVKLELGINQTVNK